MDAARLFVLALENGPAGGVYHGVAEEALPVLDVATGIGQRLGVPVKSVSPAEVSAQFSWIAPFIPVDNPASSALTRTRLGWEPTQVSLLEDLQGEHYVTGA